MKTGIISLFLLLAVTGSWATFLHPFMAFGLQSPHQQYFYNPPQRNLAQEQFFYFPQLRTHLPNHHYQSFNYIQHERQAYPLYNAPAPPRFPVYPNVRDSYNPVVQYIYQQVPADSVPSNLGYGAHVPEPALKDCNEVQTEVQPESVMQPEPVIQAELAMQPEPAIRAELAIQQEPEMQTELAMQQEPAIQAELAMQPEPAMQAELAMQPEPEMQAELAMELEPAMINKKAVETMSGETTPAMNTPAELNSMESTKSTQEQQDAMEVSTESTEALISDATPATEATPAESTTLA